LPPPSRKRITDPRYTAAVVPTYVLAGLVDVARERGLRYEPWFSGIGITSSQTVEASARISYRQAAMVIRRALRASTRGDLGLAVGSRESLVSFGVLGFAMLSSATLGDALLIAQEHHQISGSLMDPEVRLDNGEVVIAIRERFADAEILPFLCEEVYASTLMLVRSLIGQEFRPRRLELTYPAPAHAEIYRKLFGCPLRFGASENRACFDARLLAQPLPTHNPITLAHALRLCREQTEALRHENDIAASVSQWLRSHLRDGGDMSAAARELNLSERTLRRRLALCGQSFRALHDQVRTEAATALLQDSNATITTIASDLGFTDAREFRRAFRRWTGKTPMELRRR
jgi:AraC-like DNA-binding protein